MASVDDLGDDRGRHLRGRRCPLVVAGIAAMALLGSACSSGSSAPTTRSSGPPPSTAPASTPSPGSATTPGAAGLPPIRHVFLIVLENEGFTTTFATPSADPYLASTLPAAGALLTNYYAIGHNSNDNYIALISGQAPNPANQADWPAFIDFPATATVAADGQITGSGCVFPSSVPTLAT